MSSDYKDTVNKIRLFSEERDWTQFHTPKNLVISIISEIGELAEIVQWKSDEQIQEYLETSQGRQEISDEIADIAIYLIRLCQQQNLDLLTIIENKIGINSLKYPVDKSKGTSKKYTDL